MPEFEQKRSHRVAHLVQQELGRLLVAGLKDPRIGFVTVTEVRLTDDLRSASVYVSVFADGDQRQESLVGLRAAAPYLKREIGKRLNLRYSPSLSFLHDTSLDQAQRVQVLLAAAARGDSEVPAALDGAALPAVVTNRQMPAPVYVEVAPHKPGKRRRSRGFKQKLR